MAKAKAEITISRIVDIASTTTYYKLQASNLAAPAIPTVNPPPAGWVTTEPTYTAGSTNTLYFVDLTVFTNNSFSYSAVSRSSSYEAAKAAYNKATSVETSVKALEKEVELKVDAGGVISSINLSKENIAIKADKIKLEGVVTANDNFKILADGSIEAKNGNFIGDIVAENMLVNEKLKLYVEDPNLEGGSAYLTAIEMGVQSGDHAWVRFGSSLGNNIHYDNYNRIITYSANDHYFTAPREDTPSTSIVLDAVTTKVKGNLQVEGKIINTKNPVKIGTTIARDYTKVATINVNDYSSFVLQTCARDGRVLASIEIFTSQIVYGKAGACIAVFPNEPGNYSAYAYFLSDGSLYLSNMSNYDIAIIWGRPI